MTVPADRSDLAPYASDTYSQGGEDGILAEVLRRLGVLEGAPGWCVEFGAWDGKYLSNTASLICEHGWMAVLIEADPRRRDEIYRNLPREQVTALCAFVGFGAADGLDALLSDTRIPVDFDLLSIDIDGCDLHVFRAVSSYRPKVVCIEYNFTIPNEVRYEQPPDPSIAFGSSAAALVEVGLEKGYDLVAVTPTNLVLVRSDLTDLVLGDHRPLLDELRDDSSARCFVFTGYDGTVRLSGPTTLPWHGVAVPVDSLSVLPRPLQRFPSAYSPFRKGIFAAWLLLRDRPMLALKLRRLVERLRSQRPRG